MNFRDMYNHVAGYFSAGKDTETQAVGEGVTNASYKMRIENYKNLRKSRKSISNMAPEEIIQLQCRKYRMPVRLAMGGKLIDHSEFEKRRKEALEKKL